MGSGRTPSPSATYRNVRNPWGVRGSDAVAPPGAAAGARQTGPSEEERRRLDVAEDHTRSTTMATPWPPPMHRPATPRLAPRAFMA